MQHEDFKREIARLVQVFGDRNYPKERVNLLWQAFSYCQEEDVTAAVSHLIGNTLKPPLQRELAEAIEEAARERRENNRGPTKVSARPLCQYCSDSGWATVTQKGAFPPVKVCVRCPCLIGAKLSKSVPQWDTRMSQTHEIHEHTWSAQTARINMSSLVASLCAGTINVAPCKS